jgi:integrase
MANKTLDKTLNRLRPHDIPKLLQREGSHNDGGSLRLIVRGGRGSWVFQFRDGAVLRSKGLGTLPAVTLAMARERRNAIRDSHGDEPHKPKGKGSSFEVLAEQYFGHHTEIGAAQLTRNRALLRLYAGPLMRRPVNRITRQEVANVLRPIWLGSTNSKGVKLRALIERILNETDDERNPATWARVSGLLPTTKATRSAPVASLPYAKLPALVAELAATDTTVPGAVGTMGARVLRFLILTSVRLKEARGAQWSEIDFDKKLFTNPAQRMKIKDEDFVVPLSDEALTLLREMRDSADRDTNDGFIFPGRWSHQCISQNAIHLALDRLGDWTDEQGRAVTAHGFRSTMATWAQEQRRDEPGAVGLGNGVRLFDQETIEGALAHFVGGLTGTYQRSRHLEARRKLSNAWGAFCMGA